MSDEDGHRNPCVCSMNDQRWLITYTLTSWVTRGNCKLLGEILVTQNVLMKVPCTACRIVFACVRVLGSKATSRKQATVLQLLHQSLLMLTTLLAMQAIIKVQFVSKASKILLSLYSKREVCTLLKLPNQESL